MNRGILVLLLLPLGGCLLMAGTSPVDPRTYALVNGRETAVLPGTQACREYQTKAMVAGVEQTVYGLACRGPDGNWRPVN